MYPHAFRYHRAASLQEAASMIAELGDDAKLLAGGQSLIPLMKLRLSSPSHLVDLNFVPGVSYINRAGLPEDLDVTLNCRYVYRPITRRQITG